MANKDRKTMFLALVGSGEYLPPIEPLDRELIRRLWRRLGQPARVVCLPTAAGTEGEERINYWMQLGVDHFTRLGAEVEAVPVTDRASADDPALADRIARANFVYLSGGKPDYLYKTLNGSKAWDAIKGVLDLGGLLAGCSAGAMIMGEKIYAFPGTRPGFDFIPGTLVIPHFDEFPSAMVHTARLTIDGSLTILGIEGNTALVRMNDTYEVLGAGGVTVWNREKKARYMEGPLEFPV
jgi:cyanophycinase